MSRRTEQVQDVIQKELGAILSRDIEFPTGSFPNIVKVKVAADLKNATVWLGVIPSEARSRVLKTVEANIGSIQKTLNKRLTMKFVPRLLFKIDTSIDKVVRVNELVDKIQAEENGKE